MCSCASHPQNKGLTASRDARSTACMCIACTDSLISALINYVEFYADKTSIMSIISDCEERTSDFEDVACPTVQFRAVNGSFIDQMRSGYITGG